MWQRPGGGDQGGAGGVKGLGTGESRVTMLVKVVSTGSSGATILVIAGSTERSEAALLAEFRG